jgi:hypothetical protein
MYHMQINKNFMHQVGDQPRLYYDARSTNHQDFSRCEYLIKVEASFITLWNVISWIVFELTGIDLDCLISFRLK